MSFDKDSMYCMQIIDFLKLVNCKREIEFRPFSSDQQFCQCRVKKSPDIQKLLNQRKLLSDWQSFKETNARFIIFCCQDEKHIFDDIHHLVKKLRFRLLKNKNLTNVFLKTIVLKYNGWFF